MGLGTWNFKQEPTGLFKRVLRLPAFLFRARLGFLFGGRLLLITHVGRRSGRRYETPVEVVEHDRERGEYVVCSGLGPGAGWYRNLLARPAPEVQVGNRRWRPRQRALDAAEAAERFASYERRHPRAARRLLALMGNSYDGSDAGRVAMMAAMPMIAFSDAPAGGDPPAGGAGA